MTIEQKIQQLQVEKLKLEERLKKVGEQLTLLYELAGAPPDDESYHEEPTGPPGVAAIKKPAISAEAVARIKALEVPPQNIKKEIIVKDNKRYEVIEEFIGSASEKAAYSSKKDIPVSSFT